MAVVSHDPGPVPASALPRDGAPAERDDAAIPGRRLLDAAQGPLHPLARQTLLAAVDAGWADPTRLHAEGRVARNLLDRAREVVAGGLGVRPNEVSLLPSGPVALARAVDGILYAARRRGGRTVASGVEHSAVLAPGLARSESDHTLFEAVAVDGRGRVDLECWAEALARAGTVVAALQSANGEVATRQPLAEAHEQCRARGIPLVVDAMASLGRDPAPIDFDVLVGDARSWGGPPLGVLVVREGVRWHWPGGRADVEHGRTDVGPWVPLALAAAEAWQQTESTRPAEATDASRFVDDVRRAATLVPDTSVLGDPVDRLPHVVTFSCRYVDGEAVVDAFDRAGLAVASGSACTSSTLTASHVLAAMNVPGHGNVRVTLPLAAVCPTRADDVRTFCAALVPTIAAVRAQAGDPAR